MRIQSKERNSPQSGTVERIAVDPDFPVAEPDFNIRTDRPDIGPHIHDMLEIGYCYDGSGIFIAGRKMFPFKKGDAAITNTREVHIAKASPGGETDWGWLNFDPVRLLAENVGSYADCLKLSRYSGDAFRNIIDGAEYPEIANCIRLIVEEARDKRKGYRSLIRSLSWQLLLYLDRHHTAPDGPEEGCDYQDIERIVPALQYIDAHYNEEVGIPHLAKLCFTSESNFRKLFHKAMGCAARPYLLKIRMNVASTMLANTESSILEIAKRCGYATLSNFNRQFQEKYGMSPRDYRGRR